MHSNPDAQISAEVILKSESGKSIFEKDAIITSETISNYMPNNLSFRIVKEYFDSLGFQTVSGSYSITITGSTNLFESVFKIDMSSKDDQVTPIPDSLKRVVEKIVFSKSVEYF